MMKKLILFAGLFAGSSQAADLLDVLDIALQKDPALQAAKYNQQASLESKKQAFSAFLPQVSGSWSKSKSFDQSSTFGRFGTVDSPDSETDSWGISLSQSIYDQSNFIGLKQGDLQKVRGLASLEATKQDFLIRVAQAYFNVLLNIDSVSLAKAEEKAIGRQLDQAEQRYEVGLAAITDVHEARASFDASRASVIAAQNTLDDSKEALFEITRNYFDKLDALPEDIEQVKLELDSLQAWESLALSGNPSLDVAKIDAELAELSFKAQRANHLPTVSLSLSHSNSNNKDITLSSPNDPGTFITDDRESKGNSASISVNVPIFTGGRTSSLSRQSKLQYKAAMENLNQTEFATVRNIRSAFQNVTAGWSSVQARKLAVVSAKSAEQATAAGFDVGTRNIVEVLNAQRSLYQSQSNYSQAKHSYLLNILQLKRAAGKLQKQDLEMVNRLLKKE